MEKKFYSYLIELLLRRNVLQDFFIRIFLLIFIVIVTFIEPICDHDQQ